MFTLEHLENIEKSKQIKIICSPVDKAGLGALSMTQGGEWGLMGGKVTSFRLDEDLDSGEHCVNEDNTDPRSSWESWLLVPWECCGVKEEEPALPVGLCMRTLWWVLHTEGTGLRSSSFEIRSIAADGKQGSLIFEGR